MKLEIYKPKEDKDKDKVVRLELRENHYGDIILQCVDEDGGRIFSGNLLSIDKDTLKITRLHSVNQDLGFDLDKEGRVKIV